MACLKLHIVSQHSLESLLQVTFCEQNYIANTALDICCCNIVLKVDNLKSRRIRCYVGFFLVCRKLPRNTSDRSNKSDTTTACGIIARCSFKATTCFGLSSLGHHQFVSSLSRTLYKIYNTMYKIKLLLYNEILFLSSSSTGTRAHRGLWPVEQDPSIFFPSVTDSLHYH
jgi:hypothetical protein